MDEIIRIWTTASLPIISAARIRVMLNSYHKKFDVIRKYKTRKPNQIINYRQKCDDFKQQCSKLFDISSCKCLETCRCSLERKVSKAEKNF